MEYFVSHEPLKLKITLEKDASKSAEGKRCLKWEAKSSSNLVKRIKMRRRIHRPATVRGSPYRDSY